MKVANEQRKKLKGKSGITLIALVITVIVLLILAGISITMLTGNNSILNKATEAKEATDIASIKERAELAKLGLQIEESSALKDISALKKNAIANAIAKEFGVSAIGNKVTTSDNKWDIIVKDDLSIEVIRHKESSGGKEISLSFLDVESTESRAVILTAVVNLTVDGKEVPTLQEYGTKLLEDTTDETEIKRIVVDGYNYYMAQMYEQMGETLPDSAKVTWEQVSQGLTVQQFVEQAAPMYIQYGIIGQPEYSELYGTEVKITCNGKEQTINTAEISSAELVLTKNGNYDVTATIESEGVSTTEVANVTEVRRIETYYTDLYTANTVETIDGYKVTIPAGFYKGKSENIGHVTTGLVITDSVDSDGESNGNEFVWIPVTTPVADAETDGTNNKAMAVKNGDNYRGLLYNFENKNGTISSTVISGCTSTNFTNESGYREPALVTSYDNDTTNYNTIGITQNSLQGEYNDMIESVKTHGGFYVARYEMGIENSKAISKLNVTPTSAYSDDSRMWYGLYSKAKTYTNSKNSVQSSMIWGSQYDAMLNFALNGADKEKVTATTNGNHGGSVLKTGLTKTSDSINNIYDLEGNLYEWSLEANNADIRVRRGGFSDESDSPSTRGYDGNPSNWGGRFSSRLSIYVK